MTKQKTLLIISSTPRTNAELAVQVQHEAATLGLKTAIVELEGLDLPLYTPEKEKLGIPATAVALKQQMCEAHAFVLLAPEYNGGLPPVLVNAISWISRTGGDWREAFNQKPFLMGTVSGGGGTKVLEIMSIQLRHLGGIVLPRPLLVTNTKAFSPEAARMNLAWLKTYLN